MKWKINEPQNGDRRIERKFSVFPVKIGDDVVWLEPYYEILEYDDVYGWARLYKKTSHENI